MSDDKLIGWMCFLRCLPPGTPLTMPEQVVRDLRAKGWSTCGDDGSDFDFTEQGITVSDLHAADWGIDAMELEQA